MTSTCWNVLPTVNGRRRLSRLPTKGEARSTSACLALSSTMHEDACLCTYDVLRIMPSPFGESVPPLPPGFFLYFPFYLLTAAGEHGRTGVPSLPSLLPVSLTATDPDASDAIQARG